VLGRPDRIEGWHSITDFPGAATIPGIVIYRWEAPLFFANAGAFRDQIRRLARDQIPTWVVIQCEAVTDIDVTAAGMLAQLDDELNTVGVHVAFAEMRTRVQELALGYGLFETLDRDHFYPSLDAALEAITSGPVAPPDAGD
jgi:MFS superfamily sulfate permease-like transporter